MSENEIEREESEEQTIYEQQEVVWAKIRGYPWWPSFIYEVHESQEQQTYYTVFFFGDNTHAKLDSSKLRKFFENYTEYYNKAKSHKKLMSSIMRAEDKLRQNGQNVEIFQNLRNEASLKRKKNKVGKHAKSNDHSHTHSPIHGSQDEKPREGFIKNKRNKNEQDERQIEIYRQQNENIGRDNEIIREQGQQKNKDNLYIKNENIKLQDSGKKKNSTKKTNNAKKIQYDQKIIENDKKIYPNEKQKQAQKLKQVQRQKQKQKQKKMYKKIQIENQNQNQNKMLLQQVNPQQKGKKLNQKPIQKSKRQKNCLNHQEQLQQKHQDKPRRATRIRNQLNLNEDLDPKKEETPILEENDQDSESMRVNRHDKNSGINKGAIHNRKRGRPKKNVLEKDELSQDYQEKTPRQKVKIIKHKKIQKKERKQQNRLTQIIQGIQTNRQSKDQLLKYLQQVTISTENIKQILQENVVDQLLEGQQTVECVNLLETLKATILHKYFPQDLKIKKKHDKAQKNRTQYDNDKRKLNENNDIRKKTILKLQRILRKNQPTLEHIQRTALAIESYFAKHDEELQQGYKQLAYNVLRTLKDQKEGYKEIIRRLETNAYDGQSAKKTLNLR